MKEQETSGGNAKHSLCRRDTAEDTYQEKPQEFHSGHTAMSAVQG